jgi:hypothetical protein
MGQDWSKIQVNDDKEKFITGPLSISHYILQNAGMDKLLGVTEEEKEAVFVPALVVL